MIAGERSSVPGQAQHPGVVLKRVGQLPGKLRLIVFEHVALLIGAEIEFPILGFLRIVRPTKTPHPQRARWNDVLARHAHRGVMVEESFGILEADDHARSISSFSQEPPAFSQPIGVTFARETVVPHVVVTHNSSHQPETARSAAGWMWVASGEPANHCRRHRVACYLRIAFVGGSAFSPLTRMFQCVLDLDLDVFVTPPVAGNGDATYRADSRYHKVEPTEYVKTVLAKLRLNPTAPIPGAFFEHHRESYYRWRELIRRGHLRVPFTVVHVDAHSDLGNGATVHSLFEEWAHEPDKLEKDPCLNSANYLAYALTNGWVRGLANIRRSDSPDDVYDFLFKGFDRKSMILEPKKFVRGEVARTTQNVFRNAKFEAICEVQFAEVTLADLKEIPVRPDFVFVARSPAFTPVEIDIHEAFVRSCIKPIEP